MISPSFFVEREHADTIKGKLVFKEGKKKEVVVREKEKRYPSYHMLTTQNYYI